MLQLMQLQLVIEVEELQCSNVFVIRVNLVYLKMFYTLSLAKFNLRSAQESNHDVFIYVKVSTKDFSVISPPTEQHLPVGSIMHISEFHLQYIAQRINI